MSFFPLAFVFSLVAGLPAAPPVERDIWVPPILTPTHTTVWVAGQTYNVTWDTSSEPYQVTNPIGQVYLRYKGATQLNSPLAEGFQLTDGTVAVTIPADTKPDTKWRVVLFGNSGNWSPPFTIEKSSCSL